MRKHAKATGIKDTNGRPILYNALIDFTWWAWDGEHHFNCKIRHRKTGDIFDFYENGFTHKLSALNWAEDDLILIEN